MSFITLFITASMPILKVLLISALGSFLALDSVDILGDIARKHLNKVVFFVFNPALVASNLAKTITYETFLTLWFMPVNVFITFLIGSILGWILTKITKPPKHLKGLVTSEKCPS
ncbi:Protein PIN-LIKES 1 [Bienertia sinuspersici]